MYIEEEPDHMTKKNKKAVKEGEKKASYKSAEYSELSGEIAEGGGSIFWKVTLIVILVLLLAAYAGGAYYYDSHFIHNTLVNNLRLGEMTVDEAEKSFTQDFASHKIAVKEKERTEIVDPQAANTVINVGNQIKDLKAEQNPWFWPLGLFMKDEKKIYLDVSYDQNALETAVSSMECFKKENVQAPEDAYIKAGLTEFEIVPEVLGNTVKKDELIARIGDALATCQTQIDLEKEGLYYLPRLYSDNELLTKALAKANKYSHGSITYDFSYTKESVDYETLKDWIKISKEYKVSLKTSKLEKYINSLCMKYNTMGSSRDFTTSSGEKIHVYDGDYGWKIDNEKELKQLKKDVRSGTAVSREPIYEYKAQCRNSARDDIGDSYVEVSLSNQEVWLYVDGVCELDTSCVSGKPVDGRRTYTGIYSITYKQRNATLVGENYSSPVKYWMPFDGNRGLHDASWRSDFGGSIYKSNGSHGCVNLPTDAAEILFKYVDTGFPVVIYQ